jgi:hypothetical protein
MNMLEQRLVTPEHNRVAAGFEPLLAFGGGDEVFAAKQFDRELSALKMTFALFFCRGAIEHITELDLRLPGMAARVDPDHLRSRRSLDQDAIGK